MKKIKNLVNRIKLSLAVMKGEFTCKPKCIFCDYFDLCWYDYSYLVKERLEKLEK